ncbi:MAG: hypothetical protein ROZ64_18265 [Burkholderiaceae bacterium]|jgi:hypothetical protein|nr:hypothetical protein [Burkholderiaceae bacterium]
MTNPPDCVEAVHALVPPALQAMAQGHFADLAPQLRAAIRACDARYTELVLPASIWRALVGPVVDRLGIDYVDARFSRVDASEADQAEQALARFWFECASGEIGFDA